VWEGWLDYSEHMTLAYKFLFATVVFFTLLYMIFGGNGPDSASRMVWEVSVFFGLG
jgi:hypothetical protein